jgi:hypothetical protein
MSSTSHPATALLQPLLRERHQHDRGAASRVRESGSLLAWLRFGCAIFLAGLLPMAWAQDLPSVPVDPRGPIAGWVGKTLVNDQGVQAVDFKYVPPNGTSWEPQWIWIATAENGGKVPVAAHFRKVLTLPAGALITSAWFHAVPLTLVTTSSFGPIGHIAGFITRLIWLRISMPG